MIYTSYFNSNKLTYDINPVSIALSPPSWYTGEHYPDLFPTSWVMIELAKRGNLAEYEKQYREKVLGRLDVHVVAKNLQGCCMLCHEVYLDKKQNRVFCHRHIVANWLREAGYEVKELGYE